MKWPSGSAVEYLFIYNNNVSLARISVVVVDIMRWCGGLINSYVRCIQAYTFYLYILLKIYYNHIVMPSTSSVLLRMYV